MKKIKTILYALVACIIMVPLVNAASSKDIRFGGIPADRIIASEDPVTLNISPPSSPKRLAIIMISTSGLKCVGGEFDDIDSIEASLREIVDSNPCLLTAGEINIKSKRIMLDGIITSKGDITFEASERLEISPLTVINTNGTVTINFPNPDSLIEKIAFVPDPSATSTIKGETYCLGSIWGKITGVPTDVAEEGAIFSWGYKEIKISLNTDVVTKLVGK